MIVNRSVWRDADLETCPYVARCSKCGRYKKVLKRHWFFTGMYCVQCVQEVLYDNARNFEEIEKAHLRERGLMA